MTDITNTTDATFNEKAAQLRTLVEELVHLAPEAAGAKLGELGDRYQHLLAAGKEKTCQAGRQVVSTVKKYPVETALVAVAAGLATWWLVTRK